MISYIIAIFFFLILEAFFSGSEIALFSVNRAKLKYLAKNGDARAKKLYEKLQKHFDYYIATTLIGTTLSIVAITAIYVNFLMEFAIYLPALKGKEEIFAESIIVLTLLFGEILPKSIFQHFAEKLVYFIVPALDFFRKLLYPLILLANLITKIVFFVFKLQPRKDKILSREELLDALLMDSEGIEEVEKKIIANVLIFKERRLGEIVVPLSDVVAVDENEKIKDIVSVFKTSGFSRIPVYAKRIDEIVGVIRAYDLADVKPDEPVKNFAKSIRYLNEFTSLPNVLKGFKKFKDHMAVVVDERGATMGIITLEDVLEEIVGEIGDEYTKKEKKMIKRTFKDKIVVDGRIEIKEIETLVGEKFPKGPYETLGGFIVYYLGRMPMVSEEIYYNNLKFTILQTNKRRIQEVLIEKVENSGKVE